MSTKSWRIEYGNDVGPYDESFWEYYSVLEIDENRKERKIAECSVEDDADMIKLALEEYHKNK